MTLATHVLLQITTSKMKGLDWIPMSLSFKSIVKWDMDE